MTQRRFKTLLLPLCTACLLLASWMLYHSITGGRLAGCGAGNPCDSVLGSPWAYFLGIPVSLPAAVTYLLLILCLAFLGGKTEEDRSLDRLLWPLMLFLGGCIAGAALWFCWLQAGVLHTLCKYCTAMHLMGCIAAVLIFLQARKERTVRSPLVPFAAGLAVAAAFAVTQSLTKPDSVYDSGSASAALPAFTEEEVPVIRGDEGSVPLTLLFDFQCSHCRRLHHMLPELMERSGGQYSILLAPVPLSSACNPYIPASGIDRFEGSCRLTRLALAVWYASPGTYEDYWDWMLGDGDGPPPSTQEAEKRARELLGSNFETAMADPRIEAYLKKAEELFGRTSAGGSGGVPRFISGQQWLVPETDDMDELLRLIREEL